MAKQNNRYQKMSVYCDGSYSSIFGGACGIHINVGNGNIFEKAMKIPYATDSMIAELSALNEALKSIRVLLKKYKKSLFFITIYMDCETVYSDLLPANKRIVVNKQCSRKLYRSLRVEAQKRCFFIRSFGNIVKLKLITGNERFYHLGHTRADFLSKSKT